MFSWSQIASFFIGITATVSSHSTPRQSQLPHTIESRASDRFSLTQPLLFKIVVQQEDLTRWDKTQNGTFHAEDVDLSWPRPSSVQLSSYSASAFRFQAPATITF